MFVRRLFYLILAIARFLFSYDNNSSLDNKALLTSCTGKVPTWYIGTVGGSLHTTLEGRHARGHVISGVIPKFCPWKIFMPLTWPLINEAPQILFETTIDHLRLIVGLGIVC